MDFGSLEKLFSRAIRLNRRLGDKGGNGANWSIKFKSGEVHTYSIFGVKPPEEVEDDIETMFIWLWNLKDHVKKFSESKGKSGNWVESEINTNPYLAICGDIANSLKHGGLDRKSRSGKSPKLGQLEYQFPQECIDRICFEAFGAVLIVKKPKLVKLKMPILSGENKYLGDAFKYLDYAINAWEKIIDQAEKRI